MPRGPRLPVFDANKRKLPNTYRDNHGYEIILQRKGRTGRERFPRDTSIPALKQAHARIEADLIVDVAKRQPGILRTDVAAYLKTLPKTRMSQVRAAELAAWVIAWGDFRRDQITPQIVRGQLAQWQTEGRAASTLNHRRQALRSLYKALDGAHAPTPCDEVKKALERREIRAVPLAAVLAILRRLRPNATSARIKVLARTGLPHAQIARLQPSDVNLTGRTVHVTPRRKGAGTPARTLPLTYAAVRAFTLMARFNAWGSFSTSSLHKRFSEAVTAAIAKWPKGSRWPAAGDLRPYDLRHAFLTEVYRRTTDLRATAELAMHSDMSTTARYAEAAVSATASAARDAMDAPRLALRHNRRKP